ncbi:hypothetical protein [Olivibacter domesticus]|uniref:Uncharacterized protein n=1 Tax=Olivibacter domesticus TaxID=407022 RepID=A0A1H7I0D5_OLID1|nr:hypothetical protein [Olivibacter domesticus]SEK55848.1 hypothetical protein SAMN05661044_00542 [Olivibacter domesticus]
MMRKFLKNKSVISSFTLFLLATSTIIAQENSPAHVGIVYPLSTHGSKAADYKNNISLHALAGLSGGENGFALYGVAGIIKGDATGFQASGVLNKVSGTLQGVQMAGVANLTTNASRGFQFAGVFNQTKGAVQGQMAGVVNLADRVNGMQAAGVSNVAKDVKGVQLAGVFNTANEVNGSQFAGVFNKAKKVKGVQMAVINIADSSDYTIGLINIIKNGEKRIGISTDENLSSFVTFRSGGRVLYGILGVGMNPQYESLRFGIEGGIGAKLWSTNNFRLDVEASSMKLTDFDGSDFDKSGLRILPSIRIAKNIYLYGGPSINYINTDHTDGKDIIKLKVWDKQNTTDYEAINVGFTGGLQLVL